jgi:hypothetical protein
MAPNSPRFKTREFEYKGNPTIEILRDGEPFWDGLPSVKNHFSFGVNKATMILACIDIIEKFSQSEGREPAASKPINVESNEWGLSLQIVRYSSFKSYDKSFDKPYLEINGSNNRKLGFGVMKAKALIHLEEGIKKFVKKYQ